MEDCIDKNLKLQVALINEKWCLCYFPSSKIHSEYNNLFDAVVIREHHNSGLPPPYAVWIINGCEEIESLYKVEDGGGDVRYLYLRDWEYEIIEDEYKKSKCFRNAEES